MSLCNGITTRGKPCTKYAIVGSTHCRYHTRSVASEEIGPSIERSPRNADPMGTDMHPIPSFPSLSSIELTHSDEWEPYDHLLHCAENEFEPKTDWNETRRVLQEQDEEYVKSLRSDRAKELWSHTAIQLVAIQRAIRAFRLLLCQSRLRRVHQEEKKVRMQSQTTMEQVEQAGAKLDHLRNTRRWIEFWMAHPHETWDANRISISV